MPVELKEKYPFSVDTWTVLSKRKRHHFLTHAHSDHTSGIESFAHRPIYCLDTTRRLILRRFPKLHSSRFIILEIGEAKLIHDDEEPFTVTAFDANHCPGAMMLLFEGNFGNVLHTGDCRLTEDCIRNAFDYYKARQCILDCVFLDCTFGREHLSMPSKTDAFHQVQQCILDHPEAPVIYLACDMLGQEDLLTNLAECFRTKIFVDKNALPESFADLMIVAPDLVTEDPQSTRFHLCEGFPKFYERAKIKLMQARKLRQQEPLFIRPSAQWYNFEERLEGAGCGMILGAVPKGGPAPRNRPDLPAPRAAERDQHGVWHVCYSIHSSRSELERAMEILWPKEVISTTPGCHASEVMSERVDLHYVDVRATNVSTPRLSRSSKGESSGSGGGAKRTLKDHAEKVRSPASTTNSTEDKNTCLHNETLIKESRRTPDVLPNIVPLFGMARYSIPPSPPLSFASTDSQPDQEELDNSQATEEYFSDGWEGNFPDKPDQEFPTHDRANLLDSAREHPSVSSWNAAAAYSERIGEGSAEIRVRGKPGISKRCYGEEEIMVKERTGCSRIIQEPNGEDTTVGENTGSSERSTQSSKRDQQRNVGEDPLVTENTRSSKRSRTWPTGDGNELDKLGNNDKENAMTGAATTATLKNILVSSKWSYHKTGVSSVFSGTTRTLYRPMHMPIPSLLPSLMDLFNNSPY